MEARNPIFKLVNLRGVDTNVVAPPEAPDDGDDGPVIELLKDPSVDPLNLDDRAVAALREALDSGGAEELGGLTASIEAVVGRGVVSPSALADETIEFAGAKRALREIAADPLFRDAYRAQYNRWILARLTGAPANDTAAAEKRLRAGSLVMRVAAAPYAGSAIPDARRLLSAHVVLPGAVTKRAARTRTRAAATKKARAQRPPVSDRQRYEKIAADIETLDQLGTVLLKKWSHVERATDDDVARTSVAGPTQEGFLEKTRRWLLGTNAEQVTVKPKKETVVNDEFLDSLKSELSDDGAEYVDGLLKDKTVTASLALQIVEDRRAALVGEGTRIFEAIALPDADQGGGMPPSGDDPAPEKLEYAVKALGWGDLIVATERLIDYRAREIAHIENVLQGEEKVRDHSRRRTVEELLETETIEENESERELETTDRYELQSESAQAVKTDFSIDAGVNTSGRYGLTKVETSLDVDFSRSQSESRSVTTNVAKEVVDKAIERTLKKTRELRRRSVITEVIEANKHTLKNLQQPGADPVQAISGVYRWVEKIHEVQLRHYGKRLMLEFHIPEPAITLTSTKPPVDVGVDKPTKFALSIARINETNYKFYARRYRATGLDEPPERLIEVGYAWQSTPDEGTDEDKAEDTIADKVTIPGEYRVYRVGVAVYAHPAKQKHFQVRLAVGGRGIVWEPQGSSQGRDTYFRSVFLGQSQSWPDGLPVSMLAHGHFDKTLAVNLRVYCVRSPRAFKQWQIQTHEKLSAAYQARLLEYQEAVTQAQFDRDLEVEIKSRPDAINRRTEREELKKWSIKTFRNQVIDFRAVVAVDGANEVDPNAADDNARPIQFYEESFEWDQMSYFFYPYFWGRREVNELRRAYTDTDSRFEAFLRAGAARVIVPVTPGYEKRVLMYLAADKTLSEIEKINLASDIGEDDTPVEIDASEYKTLWAELLLDRQEGVALGSGTLTVRNGQREVSVNDDSTWEVRDVDVGREIFIRGNRYEIATIDTAANTFALDDDYRSADEDDAVYVTGSVPFGPPWTVNLPTNLVILDDNKDKLAID